ncbi:hypothetical protein [Haloferula sp. BvORR071]|uniref:hypothetical protein n=1 Tax=Haloferula sp. BvORR071 TaxID=1396141 RepID=UPI000551CFC5|nr:hypothetical protein [Haloferula sp. BvORR071]
MTKELLSIEKDDYETEVNLKIPSFQNFGARMGALERESFEAQFGPQGKNATSSATDQAKGAEPQMPDLNAVMADMISKQKEAIKQLPPEFAGLGDVVSGFFAGMEDLKLAPPHSRSMRKMTSSATTTTSRRCV